MKSAFFRIFLLRFSLLTFVVLQWFTSARAQTDSITVVQAPWEVQKIATGVLLKQAWFNQSLFGANQNISILEIKMDGKNRIDVAAEPRELKPTSTFGTEHQALAGVNGTFFDMKNGGSVDYLRINGKVLNESRKEEKNKIPFTQNAAVIINGNKLSIAGRNGDDNWESELKGDDVMVSGPLLLKGGQQVKIDSAGFCVKRHPRTAVVVKGDWVWFVTVDGRNDKAAGMNLFELAEVLRWLGADDAINLDGGGSTTMWVSGFPDGGIVNHPSDNIAMKKSKEYKSGMDMDNLAADVKKWNHSGERNVANVLLLDKKK